MEAEWWHRPGNLQLVTKIKTCVCAPEVDRLPSLVISGQKYMHWCQSSCWRKKKKTPPPATESSHQTRWLHNESGRAERREDVMWNCSEVRHFLCIFYEIKHSFSFISIVAFRESCRTLCPHQSVSLIADLLLFLTAFRQLRFQTTFADNVLITCWMLELLFSSYHLITCMYV